MAYEGPAEHYDLDFRDLIVAPCASYEDTLVLVHGWDREAAADEIEWAQVAIGSIYRHFGGAPSTFPPSHEEVSGYVQERSATRCPYGVAGREEHIAALVVRYLSGEGEDYPFMEELAR